MYEADSQNQNRNLLSVVLDNAEASSLSPQSLAIDRTEVQRRLQRTETLREEAGLDVVLVVGRSFFERPGDLAYLTNHFPPFPTAPFEPNQRGTGHGVLVLADSQLPVLFVDHPAVHRPLVPVEDIRATPDVFGEVAALLGRHSTWERIGIVGSDVLPWAALRLLQEASPAASWEPVDELVRLQRRLKSPLEQDLLERAVRVAEQGLETAIQAVKPGVSEREVSAMGTATCLRAGADFVRYFRVHSGPYSAWGSRWPQATDRRIETGDVIVLDAIGAASGYAFDMNRTVFCGQPAREQRERFEVSLRALDALIDAIRPGVQVGCAVASSRVAYSNTDYGQFASRSCGHGIGIETVEAPALIDGSQDVLEPGMVLCVEPGLFDSKGFGCSTEELVVVTSSGVRQLSRLSRSALVMP